MSINKIFLSGRATKDPEVRWTTGENPACYARYTLAVPLFINEGDVIRINTETGEYNDRTATK